MSDLVTTPNFDNADDFFAALLAAHEGLDEDETHAFNARLILVLANHVGRNDILDDALAAARTEPGREMETTAEDQS